MEWNGKHRGFYVLDLMKCKLYIIPLIEFWTRGCEMTEFLENSFAVEGMWICASACVCVFVSVCLRVSGIENLTVFGAFDARSYGSQILISGKSLFDARTF